MLVVLLSYSKIINSLLMDFEVFSPTHFVLTHVYSLPVELKVPVFLSGILFSGSAGRY